MMSMASEKSKIKTIATVKKRKIAMPSVYLDLLRKYFLKCGYALLVDKESTVVS